MSSVRVTVPVAKSVQELYLHFLKFTLQWYFLWRSCSVSFKVKQVNFTEVTWKKNTTPEITGKKSTPQKSQHVVSKYCQVRQATRSKFSLSPRKYWPSDNLLTKHSGSLWLKSLLAHSLGFKQQWLAQSFILFLKAAADCFYCPKHSFKLPYTHSAILLLLTQVTVAPDVADNNITCKHHWETTKPPFLDVDIFIVVSVVTCVGEKFS